MNQFRVGDCVRCIDATNREKHLIHGAHYFVTKVYDDFVRVSEKAGGPRSNGFFANRFELVQRPIAQQGWQSADKAPSQTGWYQRDYGLEEIRYSHWNGTDWSHGYARPQASPLRGGYVNLRWREIPTSGTAPCAAPRAPARSASRQKKQLLLPT